MLRCRSLAFEKDIAPAISEMSNNLAPQRCAEEQPIHLANIASCGQDFHRFKTLRINVPRQAVAYILPGGVPGSNQYVTEVEVENEYHQRLHRGNLPGAGV